MYKTDKIAYTNGDITKDNDRIYIHAVITDHKEKYRTKVRFLFDTGATGISVNANKLGIKLTEQEFVKKYKAKPINRIGTSGNTGIVYYRYIIDELKIGKFILKEFPIFITFNPNISMPLLGMSLIKLFTIRISPVNNVIILSENEDYQEYTSGLKSCKYIDSLEYDAFISNNKRISFGNKVYDIIDQIVQILLS